MSKLRDIKRGNSKADIARAFFAAESEARRLSEQIDSLYELLEQKGTLSKEDLNSVFLGEEE